MARADAFLKIGDLEGESIDDKYKGWIEIENFNMGATNSGSSAYGTGAGTGKVSMQDFSFSMPKNKVSPELFIHCCTGEHYKEAKVVCRKAGGGAGGTDAVEYLKYTFTDVFISSHHVSFSGGGIPMESITMNFTALKEEYQPQDANGKPKGGPVTQGYNIKENKKF